MTYRGIVCNGVVILEGGKPDEGTVVVVTPVEAVASPDQSIAGHPALGIWKDRKDLPDDAMDASKFLRRKLMSRGDE